MARRLVGVGVGSTMVPAIALLLVAPMAFGSGVTVLTAPYSGAVTGTSSSWSTNGCGHATVMVKPYFHASTGRAAMGNRASAPTCSNPAGSGGSGSASVSIAVPLHLTHKSVSIVTVVQVRAWTSASLKVGNCTASASSNYSYCYQYAFSEIYGYVYVYDSTSGAYYYPTHFWGGLYKSAYHDTYCSTSGCNTYSNTTSGPSQQTVSNSWWVNATLNPSDSFALVADYYEYADAYSYAYGATLSAGTTLAVANAGTMGNGVYLASITIS